MAVLEDMAEHYKFKDLAALARIDAVRRIGVAPTAADPTWAGRKRAERQGDSL